MSVLILNCLHYSNNVPGCSAAYSSEFTGPHGGNFFGCGGNFFGCGENFFKGGGGDPCAPPPPLYHTLLTPFVFKVMLSYLGLGIILASFWI